MSGIPVAVGDDPVPAGPGSSSDEEVEWRKLEKTHPLRGSGCCGVQDAVKGDKFLHDLISSGDWVDRGRITLLGSHLHTASL